MLPREGYKAFPKCTVAHADLAEVPVSIYLWQHKWLRKEKSWSVYQTDVGFNLTNTSADTTKLTNSCFGQDCIKD